MFIPVPGRDCRSALYAAAKEAQDRFDSDKARLAEASFNQLRDGAVHNGLKPTQKDIEEMRSMTERDVEHMMSEHPAVEVREYIDVMLKMLDYNDPDEEVVLDTEDFKLLGKHLPKK